ncbi:glycosyl hydrolase family 95 catalytic domain-containing protein [Paenibacillus terrigena]|uniref:glycosyl hydrolase family 95 catalytic domain-containing protein n=1 Tax=Paenibacillus terrigena TaxID=369333 RepID=UPI00037674AF|nr:dockerin type I domain-containing protein [Paenibacillus terrigena]
MKKASFVLLSWLLVIVSIPWGIKSVNAAEGVQDVNASIDWSSYLARSDMKWDILPSSWKEGVFLGNGLLGTMFWQQAGKTLNFEVSRTDVFDHRKSYDMLYGDLYSEARLPNGHFELGYVGGNPRGNMRLSLWDAEASGTITTDQGSLTINSFTHASENVIVLDVTKTGNERNFSWVWKPDPSKSTRTNNPPADLIAYPAQTQETVGDVQVSVQSMPEDVKYHTDGLGEGQYATAWKFDHLDANRQIIYISEGFSYPGTTAKQEAIDAVNRASAAGIDGLRESHQSWWHDFYPKSFISIPDAKKESFYWIQLYKLASATRADKPMIDLMGPWFAPTTWPGIWWNLNTQLTYAPLYASNHLELAGPLVDALYDNRSMLAANTGPYHADSYAIGRMSSLTMKSLVLTEAGNLTWALFNIWSQYRMTMDEALLRDQLFPLMKGNLNYFIHILGVKQSDGKYHLPGTASPEYTDSVADSNYTLSLLKWLCGAIVEANDRLQANDPAAEKAQEILSNLVPYPIDAKNGFMIGKGVNLTSSHRHWSHLMMIYPLLEYTYDNASDGALIDQSVDYWLGKSASFRGYSYLAGAAFKSMKGEGNAALSYLDTFVNTQVHPNTMYTESSPVIETPIFFNRVLQEMLLQSYNGVLRIFPSVPSTWKDSQFHQMLADGGFQISAKRQNGATQFVRIQSLAGEPLKVRTGLAGAVKAHGNRNFHVTDLGNGVVEVDLKKGEWVILYTGNELPDLTLSPVSVPDKINAWGIAMPPLSTVTVKAAPSVLSPGESTTIHLEARSASGAILPTHNAQTHITLSDNTVASLNQDTMELTALKSGDVSIHASLTMDGVTKTESYTVKVTPSRPELQQIRVGSSVPSIDAAVGSTVNLKLEGEMSDKRLIDFTQDPRFVAVDYNTTASFATIDDRTGVLTMKESPGSAKEISVTAQVTLRDAVTYSIDFEDGTDESGFGDTVWDTANKGLTLSNDMSWTGNQSAEYIGQGTRKKIFDTSQNGIITMMFYDDATIQASSMQLVGSISNGTDASRAMIGVYNNNAFYNYRFGSTWSNSSIPRSTGWHEFKWDYSSNTDIKLYIDGSWIATNTTLPKQFNTIVFGSFWGGTVFNRNFIDDIKVIKAQDTIAAIPRTITIAKVDQAALTSAIWNARDKLNAATEGTQNGQYSIGSKALLQQAIDRAQVVADNPSASEELVAQAMKDLDAAVQSFDNSVNSEVKVTLTGPTTVQSNQNFQVRIGMENIKNAILAQDYTLSYDIELYEFVQAKSLVAGVNLISIDSKKPGQIRFILVSEGADHSVIGDVDAIEVEFRAKQRAETASGTMNLISSRLADANGREYEAEDSSIVIQVVAGIPEDVNGDGKVSIGDLAMIAVHYGKSISSPDWEQVRRSDIDNNHLIDLNDLVLVARKIMN